MDHERFHLPARSLCSLVTALVLILLLTVVLHFTAVQASADSITVLEPHLRRNTEGTSFVWTGSATHLIGGRMTNLIYFHEPTTGTVDANWAQLPSERMHTSAIWTGEHVYVFGGYGVPEKIWKSRQFGEDYDRIHSPFLDSIVRFDPANDSATKASAHLPTGRWGTSTVWTGEVAYILGGTEAGANGKTPLPLDEILRYDPAQDRVTTVNETLPTGRWHASAVWTGEVAYLFGGTNEEGEALDEIIRYNPSNNTVELINATLPEGRWEVSAVWSGTHAYLFGGRNETRGFNDILRFDPTNDTIERMDAKLPFPEMWSTGAVWVDQTAYIYGGVNETADFAWILRYSPTNQAPEPAFTYKTDGTHLSVDANRSFDPDGTIVSYPWNWGDGSNPNQGVSARHQYGVPGSYNVTLTVVDNVGQPASFAKTVVLAEKNLAPEASFRVFITGDQITADASRSFDPDGTIVSYAWNWGDASPTGQDPIATHAYSKTGTYLLTLIVEDDEGAQNVREKEIAIKSHEIDGRAHTTELDFDVFTQELSVIATAKAGSHENQTYIWDWGDGATSRGSSTVRHTYDAPGRWQITLTVITETGGRATTSRAFSLGAASQVNLEVKAGVDGEIAHVGDTVPVSVRVTNSGEATVTRNVLVRVGASIIGERSVTVNPGGLEAIELAFRPETPGEHTIEADAGSSRAHTTLTVLGTGGSAAVPTGLLELIVSLGAAVASRCGRQRTVGRKADNH